MATYRVMLVCGSGASSGFMASNIRKAAKARGVDINIIARSDAEIPNYVDDTDLIMIGPHLAMMLDQERRWCEEFPELKVEVMKAEYYATLDGEKALDHILEIKDSEKDY